MNCVVAAWSGRAGFLPVMVEVSPRILDGMGFQRDVLMKITMKTFHGLSSLLAFDIIIIRRGYTKS